MADSYDLLDLIQSCRLAKKGGKSVIMCRPGHKAALLQAHNEGLELKEGEFEWKARTDSAILVPHGYDGTQEVEYFNAASVAQTS